MSQAPRILSFFHGPTYTATHLVIDPATGVAAIVDPVLDFDAPSGRTSTEFADRVLAAAAREDATIRYVLETHAHADHLTAAQYIKAKTGALVAIGAGIVGVQKIFKPVFNAEDVSGEGREFDVLLKDGDQLGLGSLRVAVMHTPGHTPACVTYVVGDAAFVGDTMFMPDYGTARADFPGGDAATLYRSIQRILSLPDTTRLFLCHDYLPPGRGEYRWQTTVADEKRNVHLLAAPSEDAYVALRNGKDEKLPVPALLLPSIQVNIRAGHRPPPENNGRRYLKLPLDVI